MRHVLFFLLVTLLISSFVACGDDATRPASSRDNGTIQGEIGDTDFEYEIRGGEPGDPYFGPFVLRGTNLHYDDEAGALVVDLTVRNLGAFPYREPVGVTFLELDPDEVTVLNPDNGEHGDGAAIVFQFTNDDAVWTNGETSIPRTVQFGVARGVSIAFVARLDVGPVIDGGAIAGRVWNDANENGEIDDTEHGIAGVALYLYPMSGDDDSTSTREVGYAETDRNGHYAFHHLRPGAYVVTTATVTNECRPTTPTEIHVLLVEANGEVSSYRNANFGCVTLSPPPSPLLGERLYVTGKFYEPDVFVHTGFERVLCPDDSIPGPRDVVPDPDCFGGRLRGPVTAVAPVRNAFKLMNTWIVSDAMNIPPDVVVGSRLDVHVHRSAANEAGWIADSIAKWEGPYEALQGRVDAVESTPDGQLRILVLDTWISLATIAVGGR